VSGCRGDLDAAVLRRDPSCNEARPGLSAGERPGPPEELGSGVARGELKGANSVDRQENDLVRTVSVDVEELGVEDPCGYGSQALHDPARLACARRARAEHALELAVDGDPDCEGRGPRQAASLEQSDDPECRAVDAQLQRRLDPSTSNTHGSPLGQPALQPGAKDPVGLAVSDPPTSSNLQLHSGAVGLGRTALDGLSDLVDQGEE